MKGSTWAVFVCSCQHGNSSVFIYSFVFNKCLWRTDYEPDRPRMRSLPSRCIPSRGEGVTRNLTAVGWTGAPSLSQGAFSQAPGQRGKSLSHLCRYCGAEDAGVFGAILASPPRRPRGLGDDNPSSATFELRGLGSVTSFWGLHFSFVKQHSGLLACSLVCCGMRAAACKHVGWGGQLQGVGSRSSPQCQKPRHWLMGLLCMDLGHRLPLCHLGVTQEGWTRVSEVPPALGSSEKL